MPTPDQLREWEKEFDKNFNPDYFKLYSKTAYKDVKRFIKSLLSQATKEAVEGERERIEKKLKGLLMSSIDLAMYVSNANHYDVDRREEYAKDIEKKILYEILHPYSKDEKLSDK